MIEVDSADFETSIVLPGDVIPVTSAEKSVRITVGPGLCHDAEHGLVAAVKAGILKTTSSANGDSTKLWVENNQRRYVPVLNESVIGIVTARNAESYRVDIGAAHPAGLGVLSFEGATKKNRPNLEVGALVFARVCLANKDMEPELDCINPASGKADGFGEVKNGFMFKCSLGLSRSLLDPKNPFLQYFGGMCPFETAIGMNGRIWVNASTPKQTITLVQATPHPYTHHIYTTEPPAEEQLTLSGFEGPEKLLEIWFRPTPSFSKYDPNGESLRSDSPVSFNETTPSVSTTEYGADEFVASILSSVSSVLSMFRSSTPTEIDEKPKSRFSSASSSTSTAPRSTVGTGLRSVPRYVWEEMLDIVKCKVLSTIHNDFADAYLLSESSMFVYGNRLMLKTCGTTTLLNAVPRILEIAREYCGMDEVDAIFYSRKAFLFPERQIYPHGKWGDEVTYLDGLFPDDTYETSGYVVGKVNGDHWCLYTATPLCKVLNEDGDHLSVHSGSTGSGDTFSGNDEEEEEEVTLEIMMQELDPNVTKIFWRTEEESVEAKEQEDYESVHGKVDLSQYIRLAAQSEGIPGLDEKIRKGERRLLAETGIQNIYPCSMVDDFLFDPCGYSLNGLLGQYYWTIHVTPEDICSYASFETTIPVRKFHRPSYVAENGKEESAVKPMFHKDSASAYESYEDVIDQVLTCFKPGKFSITLFSRKSHSKRHGRGGLGLLDGSKIDGFKRSDKIVHAVGDWDLVFAHYVKEGSKKAGGKKVF
ncbi:spermidine resistance protein [Physocladia obscura]|uniref:adenosylmethionine decarboxylase n=1 Tax=Physocladia obscura TaxID=109957 RepID=A0AAD5T992_9FUNG|nr:spermidine resistance protein [Physocladia obscura]